jgi:hypothetical protein
MGHGKAMRARRCLGTVARYQTDIMGTREAPSVLLTGVCAIKPINGKLVQTTLWESDQFIVPEKRGNACREKELAVEPLGQGHIHRTKRRVKGGNKTGLITYPENDREVLLKSRMRENPEVRFCEGAHSSFREEVAMSSTRPFMCYEKGPPIENEVFGVVPI